MLISFVFLHPFRGTQFLPESFIFGYQIFFLSLLTPNVSLGYDFSSSPAHFRLRYFFFVFFRCDSPSSLFRHASADLPFPSYILRSWTFSCYGTPSGPLFFVSLKHTPCVGGLSPCSRQGLLFPFPLSYNFFDCLASISALASFP